MDGWEGLLDLQVCRVSHGIYVEHASAFLYILKIPSQMKVLTPQRRQKQYVGGRMNWILLRKLVLLEQVAVLI